MRLVRLPQLFSCCYLIRIWARTGGYSIAISLDCRRPRLDDGYEVGLMDATL